MSIVAPAAAPLDLLAPQQAAPAGAAGAAAAFQQILAGQTGGAAVAGEGGRSAEPSPELADVAEAATARGPVADPALALVLAATPHAPRRGGAQQASDADRLATSVSLQVPLQVLSTPPLAGETAPPAAVPDVAPAPPAGSLGAAAATSPVLPPAADALVQGAAPAAPRTDAPAAASPADAPAGTDAGSPAAGAGLDSVPSTRPAPVRRTGADSLGDSDDDAGSAAAVPVGSVPVPVSVDTTGSGAAAVRAPGLAVAAAVRATAPADRGEVASAAAPGRNRSGAAVAPAAENTAPPAAADPTLPPVASRSDDLRTDDPAVTDTTSAAAPAGDAVASAGPTPPPAAAQPAMPVVGPAPVAAAAPVAAPAAATVEPEPLATQLAGPIVSLRSAPRGTHVVTVRVTPENLGPVTVRAHVHDGGMRVELFAPTQDARDALATMLIDLRRDVAAAPGAGGSFSLGLGAGDQPAGGGREQQTPGWGPRNPDAPPARLRADAPGAYRPAPRPTAGAGSTSLDVFA